MPPAHLLQDSPPPAPRRRRTVPKAPPERNCVPTDAPATDQPSAPRPAAATAPARSDELAAALELSGVATACFGDDDHLRFANDALWQLLWPEGRGQPVVTLHSLGTALRLRLREPQALPEPPGLRHWLQPGASETPLALADGRWLRLSLQPSPLGGLVLGARDVTHEVEVDRMRSEFLSTAAHEMRNPMASILGFSELLMTRTMAPAQTQELAGIIHRHSSWLVGMVNELLDLARIESRRGKDFRIQPLALQPWLDDSVSALGADAARVRLHLHDSAAQLLADPAKARHALANVLSNALKYSPDGGPVTVATRAARREQRDGLEIEVRDQGIGMDAAAVGRIFERFYRADPGGAIPGTGLGMSLVQEIMAVHRGDVRVQSQPGRGTTVTLWFAAPAAGQTA